jgi:hypothetical protein
VWYFPFLAERDANMGKEFFTNKYFAPLKPRFFIFFVAQLHKAYAAKGLIR